MEQNVNQYRKLEQKIQSEFNAFPHIAAFSKEQLAEGMEKLGVTKKEELFPIGCGVFIRRSDKPAYEEMWNRLDAEKRAAMDADATGDGYLYQMFRAALSDHEYGYTRDVSDTLISLGLSMDDIADDPRLVHALYKAMRDEAEWYDAHN